MSAGNLPYHLRLNKNVERQVFLDLLSQLSAYKPIREYSYFGFGGPFLEDFKLLHNHFKITKMYSIEMEQHVVERQSFNKPASCIKCLETTSGNLISDFETICETDNAIIWLDYTSPSELGEQLTEFGGLIGKMASGSIVKITINAAGNSLMPDNALPPLPENSSETPFQRGGRLREARVHKLESMLGTLFLRDKMTPEMMEAKKYPTVLFKTLLSVAHRALEGKTQKFEPLSAFKYSDGQQMLTLTGIILDDSDITKFKEKTSILDWEYYLYLNVNNDEPIEINMPFLSISEKLHIDQYLPSKFNELKDNLVFQLEHSPEKTKKSLENYQSFYRFYPNFSKVWI